MKAILQFNLDDIDDSINHDYALAGKKLAYIITEFGRLSLRERIKYRSDEFTDKELQLLGTLRTELAALIEEENVGELV